MECVQNSKVKIYDKTSKDDPNYLLFDEYNSQIHESYKEIFRKEKKSSVCFFIFIYILVILI